MLSSEISFNEIFSYAVFGGIRMVKCNKSVFVPTSMIQKISIYFLFLRFNSLFRRLQGVSAV